METQYSLKSAYTLNDRCLET